MEVVSSWAPDVEKGCGLIYTCCFAVVPLPPAHGVSKKDVEVFFAAEGKAEQCFSYSKYL